MNITIRRFLLIGALLMLASLLVGPSAAQELTTVKFGNLPYLDYAPWALAEELGYLEEEGIALDTSIFEVEQPMVEALINGSIEVGAGSDTPFIILAAAAPELRLVSMNAIFTGYSIMGRPGEAKTYDEFVEEGMSHEEALAAAAAQLEGKTIILPGGASFTPVLDTALEYAGLTRDDVETIDIDPAEGAAAFIQGTGDFYSDGLPMRFRLEQEGMVNVLTGVQLAGGAMVLAGVYTTDEYLAENMDVIEGMLRAWYRTIDYLKANPDEAIPVLVGWINEQTNAGFTVETAERFMEDLILFPTYEEIRDDYFYNPDSPFYWETRLQFVVDYFGEQEGLDTKRLIWRRSSPRQTASRTSNRRRCKTAAQAVVYRMGAFNWTPHTEKAKHDTSENPFTRRKSQPTSRTKLGEHRNANSIAASMDCGDRFGTSTPTVSAAPTGALGVLLTAES